MALTRRALALLLTTSFAFVSSGALASAGLASALPTADPVTARTAYAPIAAQPVSARTAAIAAHRVDAQSTLAKGYTYWGYYTWDAKTSSWPYSKVGANDPKSLPEDGDVYGFRWALVVGTDSRPPRVDGDFDAICGSEQAGDGDKRIAFVLDYGTQADAPDGDNPPVPRGVCATVDEDFTVQQALQTVAPVRTDDSGLICGIDEYPSAGCGEQLTDVTAPPADEQVALALPGEDETATPGNGTQPGGASAEPDGTSTDEAADDSSSTGTWTIALAVAAILALAVGGLVVSRRRG